MLRKKQGRCWVSERDGKWVRETATATERTRSFAALTCNSYGKRVRETATAMERRQRRRWWQRGRVREWEREWERDWDWGESESERETESEREMISVCFFKRARMSDKCFKQTEFIELGFLAQKPSSKNSVSMPRNRVLWTRFLRLQTEFNELGLKAQKTSSLNSISGLRGTALPCQLLAKQVTRVQYTRFYNMKID